MTRAATLERAEQTAFGAPAVWLDSTPRPGWMQMAIDMVLLEQGRRGERWLRVYRWDPGCLSFGRHEPAARRYDVDTIAALGLDVVRRPTGGRAVWHGRELTYAVAAPVEGLGSLRAVCAEIHEMLRVAVRALGADAELAAPSVAPAVSAGACFSSAAGGEVMVAGRKVVGSAQLRDGTAFLQHGSLLLEDDQSLVHRVTRGTPPPDHSAPLSRILGRRVTWDEAAGEVAGSARLRWGLPPEEAVAPHFLLERAEAYAGRFRSAGWTWEGR